MGRAGHRGQWQPRDVPRRRDGDDLRRGRLYGQAEIRLPAADSAATEVLSPAFQKPVIFGNCAVASYDGIFVGLMRIRRTATMMRPAERPSRWARTPAACMGNPKMSLTRVYGRFIRPFAR